MAACRLCDGACGYLPALAPSFPFCLDARSSSAASSRCCSSYCRVAPRERRTLPGNRATLAEKVLSDSVLSSNDFYERLNQIFNSVCQTSSNVWITEAPRYEHLMVLLLGSRKHGKCSFWHSGKGERVPNGESIREEAGSPLVPFNSPREPARWARHCNAGRTKAERQAKRFSAVQTR
jgi:hypothetical protein